MFNKLNFYNKPDNWFVNGSHSGEFAIDRQLASFGYESSLLLNNKAVVIILFILLAFFNPLISRFWPAFDKITIGLCLCLSLLLMLFCNFLKYLNSFLGYVILFCFALYFIDGQYSFLIEFMVWLSFFGFLFVEEEILVRNAKLLIGIILILSSLQILFDFSFPVANADNVLDKYAGTFVMANNKSRFLIYILLFLFSVKYPIKKWIKILLIIPITASMILGNSVFGMLFMIVSIFMAIFVRRFFIFLLIVFVSGVLSFNYIIKHYQDNDVLLVNYNRYLDPEHGVYGVYEYGLEQLKETDYLGVGFGNFSSRAGQFVNNKVTLGIPNTMILFNQDLFTTKSPYGLSALFALFVEMGIFSLPVIYFLIRTLWTFKHESFWGYFSFYYLFFVINYNPSFFEFSEGGLYVLTYILTNAYLKNDILWMFSCQPLRTKPSGIQL